MYLGLQDYGVIVKKKKKTSVRTHFSLYKIDCIKFMRYEIYSLSKTNEGIPLCQQPVNYHDQVERVKFRMNATN